MENLFQETQPIQDQPTEETPQPTQHISAARLAANRANAHKSTGPRTPQGKLRSASNSLQHGLYSLKNFDSFIHDNDLALTVITNYLEQFNPVTPTEHTLVHQLIHQQLRFLQMEYLFNQAMSFRVEQILKTPVPFLTQIMRELDRLPARIQRTIKAIHVEQKRRLDQDWEIEPIADQPPLPERSKNEVYAALVTNEGVVAMDSLPKTDSIPKNEETKPNATKIDGHLLFRIFADRVLNKYQQLPQEKPENEPKP